MKKTAYGFLMLMMAMAIASCDDDSDKTLSSDDTAASIAVLEGDRVLRAKTMIGDADKTLLPEGAPCLFSFEKKGGKDLVMLQRGFKIGNMPFAINFAIELKIEPLSTFEKEDYPGGGWMRFSGKRGVVDISDKEITDFVDSKTEGDGATMTGYVNVDSREVTFEVQYNMMNARINVPNQLVDAIDRADYEKAVAEYEEALAKYKKEHGLK